MSCKTVRYFLIALLLLPLGSNPSAQQSSTPNPTGAAAHASPDGSRGKRLVLKDGSYQLVREYQRNGERVRYFSSERGDWEEIPAAMVDWDATKKAEASASDKDTALLKKVHHEQEEQLAEMPMDVDASLPIAPGVFLPPGEGMFVVEGKSITPLEQAGAEIRADKKQTLKQILSPVPIVPSKKNIELQGAKSVRRINFDRPEFYLREAPPDPDRTTPIRSVGRLGPDVPELELVRLAVKGGKREIESIRSMFGQQISEDRNAVLLQEWTVAKDVYRFTMGESLQPGEYAFVQILPDGINLYVWDFGVDKQSGENKTGELAKKR